MLSKKLTIFNKELRNRIGMPPMDTLMGNDGFANDFHIQHYGSRSYGGYGIIIVESTAISKEGKIREKDLGIWKDEHIRPLTKVVDIVKKGGAIIGIQLNHAGSKAEMTDIDKIGATMYYTHLNQDRLKLITQKQLKEIEDKFVEAAKRAKKAGFDFIEIHGAHGYLINQLLHPKLNEVIKDKDVNVRAAMAINVIKRIYKEVKIPIGIRLSIVDNTNDSVSIDEYKPFIKEIEKYLSYINISSGVTLDNEDIVREIKKSGTHVFRAPLVKEIRKITTLPLMSVGNISTREDIEIMLKAGADIALTGRESLYDPNLPVHILNYDEIDKDKYHWNNNIWYNHHDYKKLKSELEKSK